MKDFFKSYSGNLLIIPNKLTKVQAPTCSSIKTIYAPPQNAQKIQLQAMQDAPPLQLYPASDKFLM